MPLLAGTAGVSLAAELSPRDTPAPLTHHEIVALAAPFTRLGFGVDLPASDTGSGWQLERRLHDASGHLALNWPAPRCGWTAWWPTCGCPR